MVYEDFIDKIKKYIIYTDIECNQSEINFVSNSRRCLANALGRSYCTKDKIVVVLNYKYFVNNLQQLVHIGKLMRSNMYIVFIGNKIKLKSPRGVAHGLGFTVFDYNSQHTSTDLLNNINELIDKIIGPVCVFADTEVV